MSRKCSWEVYSGLLKMPYGCSPLPLLSFPTVFHDVPPSSFHLCRPGRLLRSTAVVASFREGHSQTHHPGSGALSLSLLGSCSEFPLLLSELQNTASLYLMLSKKRLLSSCCWTSWSGSVSVGSNWPRDPSGFSQLSKVNAVPWLPL